MDVHPKNLQQLQKVLLSCQYRSKHLRCFQHLTKLMPWKIKVYLMKRPLNLCVDSFS